MMLEYESLTKWPAHNTASVTLSRFCITAVEVRSLTVCRSRLSCLRSHLMPRDFDKVIEDRLRKRIGLPSDFRMPLDSEHELIFAFVYHCFDHTIRRPCDGLEVS